jgi:hypothetical protein
MSVLFKISILALLALLWAFIAIARHIYLARQRHRSSTSSAKAKRPDDNPGS